jgi:hypothetical protein
MKRVHLHILTITLMLLGLLWRTPPAPAQFIPCIHDHAATETSFHLQGLHTLLGGGRTDMLIEKWTAYLVLNSLEHLVEPNRVTCIETTDASLCLDPKTSPQRMAELLRRLSASTGGNREPFFAGNGRWHTTATNGPTGSRGDPITLTYSFVPDGTMIRTNPAIGDEEGTSRLDRALKFQFFTLNSDVWKNKFRAAFERWSQVCGIRYIEVGDDGADIGRNLNHGVLGVRGDVRIGGRPIDGIGGVLAYNYFPDFGGDMVLDADGLLNAEYFAHPAGDYRYLRNVVAHEHGHGIGLAHVTPNDETKLMESVIQTTTDGPQDDDIRGAQRLYGDTLENNDTAETATDFGTLPIIGLENVSTDSAGDLDWHKLDLAGDTTLNVVVSPIGGAYQLGNGDNATPHPVNTRTINRLRITVYGADGTTVLASSEAANPGESTGVNLSIVNTNRCYVLVSNASSTDDVQRYSMLIVAVPAGGALYVDKDHVGPEQGTLQNPFRTVTAAVNAATAQIHTIYIRNGNYGTDRPRITKALRLVNWFNEGPARIGQP